MNHCPIAISTKPPLLTERFAQSLEDRPNGGLFQLPCGLQALPSDERMSETRQDDSLTSGDWSCEETLASWKAWRMGCLRDKVATVSGALGVLPLSATHENVWCTLQIAILAQCSRMRIDGSNIAPKSASTVFACWYAESVVFRTELGDSHFCCLWTDTHSAWVLAGRLRPYRLLWPYPWVLQC